VLPTGTGALADKQEFGQGRLLEPEELLVHVIENLPPSGPLVGRKMVVTAGPTWEPLDPVRMLTNRSSGKMGFAVATAAVAQGMDVTLIAGPNSLTPPPRADLIAVESAQEMHQAVEAEFPNCDVLVMSAAVADWKPTSVSDEKIKKDQGPPVVEMVPNPDILLEIGKLRTSGQILVGFAMETSDEEDNARKKLRSKNLDILVLNRLSDPDAGFAVDTNVVTIFAADGAVTKLPTLSKRDVGDRLVALILSELEGRDDRTDAERGNRIHRPADSSG
jgi:phosphopantothenoylcysteine decarboxylase/phosphopantothenate--cysteine ligase